MEILIGLVCICGCIWLITEAVKTIIYSVKAIKEAYLQDEIVKMAQKYADLMEDWFDKLQDDL